MSALRVNTYSGYHQRHLVISLLNTSLSGQQLSQGKQCQGSSWNLKVDFSLKRTESQSQAQCSVMPVHTHPICRYSTWLSLIS